MLRYLIPDLSEINFQLSAHSLQESGVDSWLVLVDKSDGVGILVPLSRNVDDLLNSQSDSLHSKVALLVVKYHLGLDLLVRHVGVFVELHLNLRPSLVHAAPGRHLAVAYLRNVGLEASFFLSDDQDLLVFEVVLQRVVGLEFAAQGVLNLSLGLFLSVMVLEEHGGWNALGERE